VKLGLEHFEGIARFLGARSPSGNARDITGWCEARDVDPQDVLLFARAITHSCLKTVAAGGEQLPACQVEAAITASVVTALQVGVDSERRRRDKREFAL